MKHVFIRAWIIVPLFTLALHGSAQRTISMQEAFELASRGNRQLIVEKLGTQKAQQAIKEAKSYLLPSVSANASYNVYGERQVIYLRNESEEGNKVQDVKFGGRYTFDGNISATYPLLSGPLRSDVRKSIIDSKMQEHQLRFTEEELAWQIGILYLDILLMQENRVSLEHSLQRNEQSLIDSRSLFLQGKNLKTDTLSNYISVQNLKSALVKAENEIIVKKKLLKHVMGLDDSSEIELADSLHSSLNSVAITGLDMSTAEENREDVHIQRLLIDRSAEELVGIKSSFKPQLTVHAQYQLQNQSDNMRFAGYTFPRTSFLGIKASVPIYSGKRRRYKTAQLEIIQQQSTVQLSEIKSRIKNELESVSYDLLSAHNDHAIQKQNLEAAHINYTMMRDRYRNGLGTRLEVTDAEVALTKARLDLVRSVYLIRVKQLQLQKAMGTIKLKIN